jgi:hypothetical protein
MPYDNAQYLLKKDKWVATPLAVVSEFFKNTFSKTIGFEWFLNIRAIRHTPGEIIRLPTIKYVGLSAVERIQMTENFPIVDKLYDNRQIYNMFRKPRFELAEIEYKINKFNFWAVGLNYIARNTGKLLGWGIVSPFTIPAFIAIKSYYKAQELVTNYRDRHSTPALQNSNQDIHPNITDDRIKEKTPLVGNNKLYERLNVQTENIGNGITQKNQQVKPKVEQPKVERPVKKNKNDTTLIDPEPENPQIQANI